MNRIARDFYDLLLGLIDIDSAREVVETFVTGMNELLGGELEVSFWDTAQESDRDREIITISDQSYGQIAITRGWSRCDLETKTFIRDATNILATYLAGHDTTVPTGICLLAWKDAAEDRQVRRNQADVTFWNVDCNFSDDRLPWHGNEAVETAIQKVALTGEPLRTSWLDQIEGQLHRVFDIRAIRLPGDYILVVFQEVSFERMRQVYNAILGNVWLVDADCRIQHANQAMADLLNTPLESVVGRKCSQVLDCRHYRTPKCTMQRVMGGEITRGLEAVIKDANGNDIVCSISAWPRKNATGETVGMLVGFKDITEKKRLEAIAATVDMTNNLAGVFSGIRHEIGNPINSMKMALSVLKSNLHLYSRAYIREYVERLADEVQRVEYLLSSLKSFNMYEKPQIKNCDIHQLIDEIDALAFHEYQARGCHVFRNYAPTARWVRLDPRAMHQVMLNLMTNAMDALEGKENQLIEIDVRDGKNVVLLTIKDNGCGMTQEQIDKLFKPFFTTKPSGTGMGLVIAEKMLAQMGCSIQVESEVGRGTQVLITIPEGHPDDAG